VDSTLSTAIIASSTSIIVIVVTHYLQKKREDTKLLRDEKLTYYKELLRSVSELLTENHVEGRRKFAECQNMAPLYVSVPVLKALYDFRHCIRDSASDHERNEETLKFTVLMDEIRRDLKFKDKLFKSSLMVVLWASEPPISRK
jgi:hypothetical protein